MPTLTPQKTLRGIHRSGASEGEGELMNLSQHQAGRPIDRDVAALIGRAGELARNSDFGSEAERLNRRILDLLPDDTGSMTRLAWCLVMRVRPVEAEDLYKRALHLEPENRIAANKLLWLRGGGATPARQQGPASGTRTQPRSPKAPSRPRTIEVVIPTEDAARFAEEMKLPFYRSEERDYKVAVHLVISALLSPENRNSVNLPALIADVFGSANPSLDALGLTRDQQHEVLAGVEGTHGLRGAFSNLTGGHVGFWQFTWIPDAIAKGFGKPIADALCDLVDDSKPLADRVNGFRSLLTGIAAQAKQSGVRVVTGFQTSTNFAALILGGYDPRMYTFYMAGALKHGYARYAPGLRWPARCSMGETYLDVCTFMASIEQSLRGRGVPIRDLIDAQSMIWIRFRPPENRDR